jgi:hypothetical protein
MRLRSGPSGAGRHAAWRREAGAKSAAALGGTIVVARTVLTALGAFATAWGASAGAQGCASISIAQENAKPGSTGWEPASVISLPPGQGYVNTTSAVCGQRVTDYLGTPAARRTLVGVLSAASRFPRPCGRTPRVDERRRGGRAADAAEDDRAGDQHGHTVLRPTLRFTIPHS